MVCQIDYVLCGFSSIQYYLWRLHVGFDCVRKVSLQGYPLFPFLLILRVEGLTILVLQFESSSMIHQCRVAHGAPTISHLFFADDSFFFFKATKEECAVVKECFWLYGEAFGRKINFQKSSVSFCKNIDPVVWQEICNIFQVRALKIKVVILDFSQWLGGVKKRYLLL